MFEQKVQFQFEKQHEFNAKTKERQDQLASAVETGFANSNENLKQALANSNENLKQALANMKEELAAHFKKVDEANKDFFKKVENANNNSERRVYALIVSVASVVAVIVWKNTKTV